MDEQINTISRRSLNELLEREHEIGNALIRKSQKGKKWVFECGQCGFQKYLPESLIKSLPCNVCCDICEAEYKREMVK